MLGHGRAILLHSTAGGSNPLSDVNDDTGESVFVQVDFLIIRNLANGAGSCQLPGRVQSNDASYLTSAKLAGRSAMRAPPNSGVLRNSAIAINVADTRWRNVVMMAMGPIVVVEA